MVKISTNIKNFIETITKGLFYTKTETDTKLNNKANKTTATTSANGLMSKEDKSKLNGIATEANKTVVDSNLSSTSTNPVQNKVINSALSGKANSSHSHSITDVTNLQSSLDSKAGTSIATTSANGLMSSSDKTKLDGIATGATKVTVDTSLSSSSTNPVQNKVINTALDGKANSSHNHSISNITDLQLTLENKSPTGHTHDDRYYTETEMDTKLNGKANTSHTHNDTYYTKDEINTRLGDIETILNEILGV